MRLGDGTKCCGCVLLLRLRGPEGAIPNHGAEFPPKTGCRQTRNGSRKDRRDLLRPEEDHRGTETGAGPSRRDATGYLVLTAHLHTH